MKACSPSSPVRRRRQRCAACAVHAVASPGACVPGLLGTEQLSLSHDLFLAALREA